jgi:hypothetical protein
VYDAFIPKGAFFDVQWANIRLRIVEHLTKAHYVPVNVSDLRPDQIEPYWPNVFIIGMS